MITYHIKTVIVLGSLSGLLIGLAHVLGGTQAALFILALSAIIPFISYFYADSWVLKLYRATPLDRQKYPQVYISVDRLCARLGIPVPKIWLIPTNAANAFATGRNPAHGNIAFTQGILSLLQPAELDGVIAHELSHIKNRDTLYTTLAVVIAHALSTTLYFARLQTWRSGYGNSDSKERTPSFLTIIALSVMVPLIATLLQLLLSRTREYLADETGARACGDPEGLARALAKIEHSAQQGTQEAPNAYQPGTESMFFLFPYRASWMQELFSTHPSTKNRIERLRSLFYMKGF